MLGPFIIMPISVLSFYFDVFVSGAPLGQTEPFEARLQVVLESKTNEKPQTTRELNENPEKCAQKLSQHPFLVGDHF